MTPQFKIRKDWLADASATRTYEPANIQAAAPTFTLRPGVTPAPAPVRTVTTAPAPLSTGVQTARTARTAQTSDANKTFYQPSFMSPGDYQASVERMNTFKYDKYSATDKSKFNQRLAATAEKATERNNRSTGLRFRSLLDADLPAPIASVSLTQNHAPQLGEAAPKTNYAPSLKRLDFQTPKASSDSATGRLPKAAGAKASPTDEAWFGVMTDVEKAKASNIKNPVELGRYVNSLNLNDRAIAQRRRQQDETAARFEARTSQQGPMKPTKNATGSLIAEYAEAGKDAALLEFATTGERTASVGDMQYLTDAQRDTILKLAKSGDYQAVKDYYDAIEYKLQAQSRESLVERGKSYGYEHPVYSIAPEGVLNMANGIPAIMNALYSKAKETFTGEWTPLDPNSHVYDLVAASQSISEGAQERIAGIDSPLAQRAANIARSGASSALTNGIQLLAGGALGLQGEALSNFTLAVMGASAAGQTLHRELKGKSTNDEALANAVASGVIETLTEKVSLDRFVKILPSLSRGGPVKEQVLRFMKEFAIQGGIEGLEEIAGNLLEQTWDIAYEGENSEYSLRTQAILAQKIIDNGGPEQYTPTTQDVQAAREQAFTGLFVEQSVDAFLSAAFSSFLLTGAPVAGSNIGNNITKKIEISKAGNRLKRAGELDNEILKAEQFPGSKAAQMAAELRTKRDKGQDVGGYKVGKMAVLTNYEIEKVLNELAQSPNEETRNFAQSAINSDAVWSVNLTPVKLQEIFNLRNQDAETREAEPTTQEAVTQPEPTPQPEPETIETPPPKLTIRNAAPTPIDSEQGRAQFPAANDYLESDMSFEEWVKAYSEGTEAAAREDYDALFGQTAPRLPGRVEEQPKSEQREQKPAPQETKPKKDANRGESMVKPNQYVDFHWAVVPVDSLNISHDEYGNANPQYPERLQPRDRSRMASQSDISSMAHRLDPIALSMKENTQNGAPLVNQDGAVISGNARSAAIRAAYDNKYEAAANYERYIREHAEEFGLDPAQIPERPALVRVADNVADEIQLARDSNVAQQARLSPSEQAELDAEWIGDIIQFISPSESGGLNATENKDFRNVFMAALPSTERSGLLNERGELTDDALRRANNAVLAYAYQNKRLTSRFADNGGGDMKNIVNALVEAAPKIAKLRVDAQSGEIYDLPVIDTVLEGVELFETAKRRKASVAEIVDQANLNESWDANAALIAEVLERFTRSARGVRAFLNDLAGAVYEFGASEAPSLFGGSQNATIEAALDTAAAKANRREGTNFQRREGQFGQSVSGRENPGVRTEDEQRRPDGESVSPSPAENAGTNAVAPQAEAESTTEAAPKNRGGMTLAEANSVFRQKYPEGNIYKVSKTKFRVTYSDGGKAYDYTATSYPDLLRRVTGELTAPTQAEYSSAKQLMDEAEREIKEGKRNPQRSVFNRNRDENAPERIPLSAEEIAQRQAKIAEYRDTIRRYEEWLASRDALPPTKFDKSKFSDAAQRFIESYDSDSLRESGLKSNPSKLEAYIWDRVLESGGKNYGVKSIDSIHEMTLEEKRKDHYPDYDHVLEIAWTSPQDYGGSDNPKSHIIHVDTGLDAWQRFADEDESRDVVIKLKETPDEFDDFWDAKPANAQSESASAETARSAAQETAQEERSVQEQGESAETAGETTAPAPAQSRDYSKWERENDFGFSEVAKEALDRLPDAEEKLDKLAEETRKLKAEVMDFFGTIADAPTGSVTTGARPLAEYWRGYFKRLFAIPDVFVNETDGSVDWSAQLTAGTRESIVTKVFNGLASDSPELIGASFTLDLDNTSIRSIEGARLLFEAVRGGHFDFVEKHLEHGMPQRIVDSLDKMYRWETAYQDAKQTALENLYGFVNNTDDWVNKWSEAKRKRFKNALLKTKKGSSVTEAERIYNAVMDGAEPVFQRNADGTVSRFLKTEGAKKPERLSEIAYRFVQYAEAERMTREQKERDERERERRELEERRALALGERNPTITASLPAEEADSGGEAPQTILERRSVKSGVSQWNSPLKAAQRNVDAKRLSEIAEDIRQIFGANVTIGYVKPGAIGQYNTENNGIRIRTANDIPTLLHEAGHKLDKLYNILDGWNIPNQARDELINNLDPELKSKYNSAALPAEGFAEYMRQFLTDRDAAAHSYPEFTDFFKKNMPAIPMAQLESLADEISRALDNSDSAAGFLVSANEKPYDARPKKEIFTERLRKAYQSVVSSQNAIDNLAKQYGANFHILFSNTSKAHSMLDYMLTHDLRDFDGQIIGKGLRTILQGIDTHDAQAWLDFNEYLVVKHGPERLEQGKRVFPDPRWNTPEAMNARASELERKYPEFQKVAEDFYEFERKAVQAFAVDAGLVSQEKFDAWSAMYPHYVPFHRDMSQNRALKRTEYGSKRGYANQNSPVKKAHGSGRDIIYPVEGFINDLMIYVETGMKNRAMLALADAAQQLGIDAAYLEKVSEEEAPQSVQPRKRGVKAAVLNALYDTTLERIAGDMDEEIAGDMSNIMTQYTAGFNESDVISVMRNGQKEYWKINDIQLLESLTNLSAPRLSVIGNLFANITRLQTSMITGIDMIWSITSNSVRDFGTYSAFFNDNDFLGKAAEGKKLDANFLTSTKEWAKSMAYIVPKLGDFIHSEEERGFVQEFYALGGQGTGIFNISNKSMAKSLVKKVTGMTAAEYAKDPLRAVVDFTNFVTDMISGPIEQAPRLAKYKYLRRMGISPQEAFYAASDITVNFSRGGVWSKTLNTFVPFSNATIQGTDKMLRFLTADYGHAPNAGKKARGRVLTLLAVSAVFNALNYLLNYRDKDKEKEYLRTSNFVKNSYFNIPTKDGKYLSIVKPRELAIVESFMERATEAAVAGNRHAFDDFGDYMTDNLLPSPLAELAQRDPGGAIGSVTLIGPVAYVLMNRDFKGSPIVSESLKRLNAESQYTNSNSKLAVVIGQQIGASPIQIDFLMSQYFAAPWKLQKALFPVGGEYRDATLGVKSRFAKDSLYSIDVVNRAYEHTKQSGNDSRSYPDDIDKAILSKLDSAVTQFYSTYHAIAKNETETNSTRMTRASVLDMMASYESSRESGRYNHDMRVVIDAVRSIGSANEVFPSVLDGTVKDGNGQEHSLTSAQYVDLQTAYQGLYYSLAASILPSASNDDERYNMLKKVKDEAKELAVNETLSRLGYVTVQKSDKRKADSAISTEDYVKAKAVCSGVESIRYESGKKAGEAVMITVKYWKNGKLQPEQEIGSESIQKALNIRRAVKFTGDDAQKRYNELFESLGIARCVWNKSEDYLQSKLDAARKKGAS